MAQVLGHIKNCEAYLKDVVVFTDTLDSHLSILDRVFARVQTASLTLNLAKCEFGHATVTYLGKQLGHGTVCPPDAKVQAIVLFPSPKTK